MPTTTGGFLLLPACDSNSPFSFRMVTFSPAILSLSCVFKGYPIFFATRFLTLSQFNSQDLNADAGSGGPPTKSSTLTALFSTMERYHRGARRSTIRQRKYRPTNEEARTLRAIAHGCRDAMLNNGAMKGYYSERRC